MKPYMPASTVRSWRVNAARNSRNPERGVTDIWSEVAVIGVPRRREGVVAWRPAAEPPWSQRKLGDVIGTDGQVTFSHIVGVLPGIADQSCGCKAG